jgi:hypothetical protein
MARNAMSRPVSVRHVCEEHGERLIGPVSLQPQCTCGRPTRIDAAAWVAEVSDLYPNESLESLAAEAGVPYSLVEEAINTEGV